MSCQTRCHVKHTLAVLQVATVQLLGRTTETEFILSVAEAARGGRGQAVLLTAGAGMGKTAMRRAIIRLDLFSPSAPRSDLDCL